MSDLRSKSPQSGTLTPRAELRKKAEKAIHDAGEAVSDLNIFYAIIAILEGGCIHAPSHKAANRIIAICKSESAKRLDDYGRNVTKALQESPQ